MTSTIVAGMSVSDTAGTGGSPGLSLEISGRIAASAAGPLTVEPGRSFAPLGVKLQTRAQLQVASSVRLARPRRLAAACP